MKSYNPQESVGTCPQKEQHVIIPMYYKFILNRRKFCFYCIISLPLYLAFVKPGTADGT